MLFVSEIYIRVNIIAYIRQFVQCMGSWSNSACLSGLSSESVTFQICGALLAGDLSILDTTVMYPSNSDTMTFYLLAKFSYSSCNYLLYIMYIN